mmetsp:Transcript_36881/g.88961  ORF Transcript_36881/g.88961 Transcript_36881/m.88961 type:complete len:439 (-) Transcript_36881:407-1723(-)
MTCCRFPPLPSPIPNHKKTNKENQENMKTSPLLLAAVAVAVVAPIASGRAPLSDRTSRGNLGPTPSRRLAKGPQSSSPLASASVFPPRSRGRVLSTPTAPRNLGSKTGKSSKNGKHGKSSKSSQSSSAHHYVAPHGMNLDGVNTKSGKSSKSAKAPGGSKSKSGKVGKSSRDVYRPAPVAMMNPPTPLLTPPPTKKDHSFWAPSPSPTTLQQAWFKAFRMEGEGTNPCIGSPCPNTAHCRSQFGTCGPGMMYCNSASVWTNSCPTLAPTPPPTRSPVVTIEPTFNMKTVRASLTPEPTYNTQLSQSAFSTPEPTEDTLLSQSTPMFEEEFLEVSDELKSPNEATEEDEMRLPPPSVKESEPDSSSGLPIGAWIGIAVTVAVAVMAGVATLLYRQKLSMQNQLSSPVDETDGAVTDVAEELIGTAVGEGGSGEPVGAAV